MAGLAELLKRTREPGSGTAFFLADAGVNAINDDFSPLLGMFKMPTPAFYGGHFPQGDWKAIVHSTQASIPPTQLPREVAAALEQAGAAEYDVFFIVADMSAILARHGERVNIVHHPWAIDLSSAGNPRSIKQARNFPMGAFLYPGCKARANEPKTCMPIQCLDRLRVSVHTQRGGICCSPNNARILLDSGRGTPPEPGSRKFTAGAAAAGSASVHGSASATDALPVSTLWTAIVDPEGFPRPRACVSLLWLLHEPLSALDAAVDGASTLGDLADALAAAMLASAEPGASAVPACVQALHLLLGQTSAANYPPPLFPPMHSAKAQGGSGGGGSRGGVSKGKGKGGRRGRHEDVDDTDADADADVEAGSRCEQEEAAASGQGPAAPTARSTSTELTPAELSALTPAQRKNLKRAKKRAAAAAAAAAAPS